MVYSTKNIFLYAIFSTIILVLGFTLFTFLWYGNIDFILENKIFSTGLFFILLLGLIIFYWLILKNQRRKYFTELLKNIPQVQSKQVDFEKLSLEISAIAKDQSEEIVNLNERENYRREFLGNISHELKTPLFSVQGYLLTLIEGGLEDENIKYKYLNRINKSVERLIYLVKDLDMLSEFEKGIINIDITTFNISALAKDVIDLLEIKAEKNNIKLIINNPINNPIKVKGDIQKIQQVLINLLVNAINYSNSNTEISIEFEEIDNKIKIAINDQGIGIRKEQLDRIFERFYRIDKSRNRNSGGSGLGLAIVKHILEAHKEKINVKSKVGKGSTFSFFLPKA